MTGGPFRMANLALAFVLEMAALASLAAWGVQAGGTTIARVALAVGAPLAAAVLWGLFAAPRAVYEVAAARVAVKVLVFGAAALALYASGRPTLAVAYAVLVVLNSAVLARGARERPA